MASRVLSSGKVGVPGIGEDIHDVLVEGLPVLLLTVVVRDGWYLILVLPSLQPCRRRARQLLDPPEELFVLLEELQGGLNPLE